MNITNNLWYYYFFSMVAWSFLMNLWLYSHIKQRKDIKIIQAPMMRKYTGIVLSFSYLLAPLMVVFSLVVIGLTPLINFFSKRRKKKYGEDMNNYIDRIHEFDNHWGTSKGFDSPLFPLEVQWCIAWRHKIRFLPLCLMIAFFLSFLYKWKSSFVLLYK